MRIIVCGSRDATEFGPLERELNRVITTFPSTIVHGACPTGADAFACEYAKRGDHNDEPHPADWQKHAKSAGPIRNREMAAAGADLCIALWDGRSKGTLDMITRATKAGIPVRIVPCRQGEES